MTDDLFTSRPLADAQKQYAQATTVPASSQQRVVRPQPVVDINLDEVPEVEYQEFTFQLQGNVYTLGIEDDGVLFEIADLSADDLNPSEILEVFFERTFRRARNEHGEELEDGLEHLLKVTAQRPRDGSRPIPRKNLLRIMNTAVEDWMGELTDTSVRPARRRSGRRR